MSAARTISPDANTRVFGKSLLTPARDFFSGVAVIAGPWIISILVLAIISTTVEPLIGWAATEDLRLAIIYSLCLALLTAAPIGIIAASRIRKLADAGTPDQIPLSLLSAILLSGFMTAGFTVVLVYAMPIADRDIALAFLSLCVINALLWTCITVLAGIRAYRFLIVSFAITMMLCLVFTYIAASAALRVSNLIWGFAGALAVFPALVLVRTGALSPPEGAGMRAAMQSVLGELRDQRYLALGTLFAFCGVWIDKWIVWIGPDGDWSLSGFRHLGSYDSVMFLAHLSVIPAFAALYLVQEKDLFPATRAFQSVLASRANLSTIREAVDALSTRVWNGIFLVILVQATITSMLVLCASIFSRSMHFDFDQFVMLRVALIAVFLHSIFYLFSSVLILCGRTKLFCIIQAVFFIASLIASIAALKISGPSPLGFFAASALASLLCFVLAFGCLKKYDYLVLLGENDGLFTRK